MSIPVGIAALGFQGYRTEDAKLIINVLKTQPVPVLAFLYNSFGKSTANLISWYKNCGDNAITMAYLSNEVDRRKSRIDKFSLLHQMTPGELNTALENNNPRVKKAIQTRAKKLYRLHQNQGKGQLRIVCGLEHQMTQKATNTYVSYVKEVVGAEVLVGLNPVIRAPFEDQGKADFLEIHEVTQKSPPRSGKFIATTDGYDILPTVTPAKVTPTMSRDELHRQINKWQSSEFFLLWHSQFNALSGDSGANPPPYQRISKLDSNFLNVLKREYMDRYKPSKPANSYPSLRGADVLIDPMVERGGFVFKETDHGNGTLVVLFPIKYDKAFLNVTLHSGDGRVDKLTFVGFTNEHLGKQMQTWRSTKQFGSHGKKCVLRARIKRRWFDFWSKKFISWKIEDSSKVIRVY